MGNLRTLDRLEVTPRYEEVVRLLGNRPKKRPKPTLEKQILKLQQVASNLAHPRGIYGIFNKGSSALSWLEMPTCSDFDYLALGAVTVGNTLTEKITDLSSSGNLAQATIFDAFGSEIVEGAATIVDEIINRQAIKLGLQALPRRSPGYGEWSIEQQIDLLRTVDGSSIGISVSPSMLMTPRKSISFALPLLPKEEQIPESEASSCSTCDFKDCALRRKSGETR
jgi:hypothetical protein